MEEIVDEFFSQHLEEIRPNIETTDMDNSFLPIFNATLQQKL